MISHYIIFYIIIKIPIYSINHKTKVVVVVVFNLKINLFFVQSILLYHHAGGGAPIATCVQWRQ